MVHFNKKDTSISKQKSKVKLEDICCQLANLMKSYGYFHHFIPFVHLDGFGRNQLYKYSGLKLLIKSRFLKDMIQKDTKESQEADIDEYLRDQLDLAISLEESKMCRSIVGIAQWLNPQIRGWLNYYGKFRMWEMQHIFRLLHSRLVRWARRKYKRYKNSICRAYAWLKRIKKQFPYLFYHWKLNFSI